MGAADLFESALNFAVDKSTKHQIKVVGVGGGGSNTAAYIYSKGLKGIDIVICNTDLQALQNSSVPNTLQLGPLQNKGLGAGARPENGERAALESLEDIQKLFPEKTEMVFITAGMGGGTGSGAAHVIAKVAKEMGKLVVAVVTNPYTYEGPQRMINARAALEKLKKHVDGILVIDNDKLFDIYPDIDYSQSWDELNDILYQAVKGMVQVITNHFAMNIDLADARTILERSGSIMISSSIASGEDRVQDLCKKAFNHPMLSDIDVYGSRGIIMVIKHGKVKPKNNELKEIVNRVIEKSGVKSELIHGIGYDPNLKDDQLELMIIFAGFKNAKNDLASKTDSGGYYFSEEKKQEENTYHNIKPQRSFAGKLDLISFAESIEEKYDLDNTFGINVSKQIKKDEYGMEKEYIIYTLSEEEYFSDKKTDKKEIKDIKKPIKDIMAGVKAMQSLKDEPEFDIKENNSIDFIVEQPEIDFNGDINPFNSSIEEATNYLAKKRDEDDYIKALKNKNLENAPAYIKKNIKLDIKSLI